MKPGDFAKHADAMARWGLLGLPAIAGGIEGGVRGLWAGLRGAARPVNTGFFSGAGTGALALREMGEGSFKGLAQDMMHDPSLAAFGLGIPALMGSMGGGIGSRVGHLAGSGGRALGKRVGLVKEVLPPPPVPPTAREQLMAALKSFVGKHPDAATIGAGAVGGLGLGKALSD